MADVTVEMSYAAIGELMRAPEMEAEMVRRGEAVMALAIATAPVAKQDDDWDGRPDPHRGRYKESFHISSGPSGLPGATVLSDRAWCMVENDAPEAIMIEWGNKNITARHTLLKALIEGARD
jgi:hypothetical protein